MFKANYTTPSHKYFQAPKYKIGDIVIIKISHETSKTLEQGKIIASWVTEDDCDTDKFLMNEWEYKIEVAEKIVIKREKSIIYKMYEYQR